MSTTAPPPPPAIKPAPAPTKTAPGKWQTGAEDAGPPRLVINGVEGIGKTSLGSHAPGAAVIMARGETGYKTLLGEGRVPELPRMLVSDWLELLATVQSVAAQPGEIKTLVLDALGGFETLCHEHVCEREYKGDWGEKGFGSFQRGYSVSAAEWLKLIKAMDDCHDAGIGVIMLSHVQVKTFDNPEGKSYSRYETAVHKTTWAHTHKWADAVLFYTFKQALAEDNKKTHGLMQGGRTRVMYTVRSDAYDAKNRHGMPPAIPIPDDPAKAWAELTKYFKFYNNATGESKG